VVLTQIDDQVGRATRMVSVARERSRPTGPSYADENLLAALLDDVAYRQRARLR
jgi:hypothetical protein